MPVTVLALSVGILAIIGIPPTNGFLGKWYIALGAFEAGRPVWAFVLVFGALLIMAYYVRMFTAFFFGEPAHQAVREAREAPASMLVPILVLTALCLVTGLLGRIPLDYVEPAVSRLLTP